MSRTGKIARLPRPIRDQLNHRLENGAPDGELLPWLNALPEVRQLLALRFAGRPITKQNLSDWRLGGYEDWALRKDMIIHAATLATRGSAGAIDSP